MNKKIIATGIIIFIVAVGGFFYKSSHAEKNPINEYRLMRVSKGAGKGYIDVDGNVEANDTKKFLLIKNLKLMKYLSKKEIMLKKDNYL